LKKYQAINKITAMTISIIVLESIISSSVNTTADGRPPTAEKHFHRWWYAVRLVTTP
jgi:hypothetical protein